MIYFVYGTLKENHRLNWIQKSRVYGECETLHSDFDIKDFLMVAFHFYGENLDIKLKVRLIN